jgi:hypothetical protein
MFFLAKREWGEVFLFKTWFEALTHDQSPVCLTHCAIGSSMGSGNLATNLIPAKPQILPLV